ncbi:MAG: hypothetical protein V7749_15020, partial [Cocleimonas sp.]
GNTRKCYDFFEVSKVIVELCMYIALCVLLIRAEKMESALVNKVYWLKINYKVSHFLIEQGSTEIAVAIWNVSRDVSF